MRGKTLVEKKIYQYSTCYDVPTILFFAGFFLHELSVIIDASMWSYSAYEEVTPVGFLAKIIRFASYGLFLLKILYDCRIGKKNVLFIYAAVGIVGLSFIGSRSTQVVFYLLVMIAAIGITDKTILFSSITAQCFLLFVTIGFSAVGIIENIIKDDNTGRVRGFLGFLWATNAPILFFFIVLQYIYLKKGRISLINAGLLVFIDYLLFAYTDSKAAFAITLVAVMFFFLFGSFEEKGRMAKVFKWLVILLPWILSGLTIYVQKVYNKNNPIMHKLNVFLSNRLDFGHKAIHKYGIHLFGNKIKWVGYSVADSAVVGDYNFVDCSYLKVLLEYGVVFLIMLLVIYSVIIYKAYESKKYYAVWITAFILMFGMTEPILLNLVYNPFVILAFASFGVGLREPDLTKADFCGIMKEKNN